MLSLAPMSHPKLEVFQVHAFSEERHGGNPAGVCLLPQWLDDARLSLIAQDLGPSVTAFVVAGEDGHYPLRWFTRTGSEVQSFCGHATFSAAHVLLRLKRKGSQLRFLTVSGTRHVGVSGQHLQMTVPTWPAEECPCPELVLRAIGRSPAKCLRGPRDYLLVFDKVSDVTGLTPDYGLMRGLGHSGVIATAHKSDADIVHRFFCPGFSIATNEDHATGSAISTLFPYWAATLGRTELRAFQMSARRGYFLCVLEDEKITIKSNCATFVSGTLEA